MKLITAIVNRSDEDGVIVSLNKKGYSVTKLGTTGGFLRAKNSTLLIGTDKEKVDEAIAIIKSVCGPRQHVTVNPMMLNGSDYYTGPVAVDVGGATIFVTDVERFEKI